MLGRNSPWKHQPGGRWKTNNQTSQMVLGSKAALQPRVGGQLPEREGNLNLI